MRETRGSSSSETGDGGGGGGGAGSRRFFAGRDRSQRLSEDGSTSSRPRLIGGALEEDDVEEDEEMGRARGGLIGEEMPPGEACFEVGLRIGLNCLRVGGGVEGGSCSGNLFLHFRLQQ